MKGSVFNWIIILVLVSVVTSTWIMFSPMYTDTLFPWGETRLAGDADALETLSNLENYWNWWPMIFLFGLTIYGILSSTKHTPDSQYMP